MVFLMNAEITWETLKDVMQVVTKVRGVVSRHLPFGIFVSIDGVPFQGLVQITDFKDSGKMTAEEYPAIGAKVESVVLGFKETGNQIWLGMKPSQLRPMPNGPVDRN